MKTTVKTLCAFTCPEGRYKKGILIAVAADRAEYLVAHGFAAPVERVAPKSPRARKAAPKATAKLSRKAK